MAGDCGNFGEHVLEVLSFLPVRERFGNTAHVLAFFNQRLRDVNDSGELGEAHRKNETIMHGESLVQKTSGFDQIITAKHRPRDARSPTRGAEQNITGRHRATVANSSSLAACVDGVPVAVTAARFRVLGKRGQLPLDVIWKKSVVAI